MYQLLHIYILNGWIICRFARKIFFLIEHISVFYTYRLYYDLQAANSAIKLHIMPLSDKFAGLNNCERREKCEQGTVNGNRGGAEMWFLMNMNGFVKSGYGRTESWLSGDLSPIPLRVMGVEMTFAKAKKRITKTRDILSVSVLQGSC